MQSCLDKRGDELDPLEHPDVEADVCAKNEILPLGVVWDFVIYSEVKCVREIVAEAIGIDKFVEQPHMFY